MTALPDFIFFESFTNRYQRKRARTNLALCFFVDTDANVLVPKAVESVAMRFVSC
jgi:hypothetical protein